MPTLAIAIETAARAHAGRIGEDGDPEVLHCMRVMLRLQADDERQVAMLHDVIEDGGMHAQQLLKIGFASDIVQAVEVLTGRPDETYDDYIQRVIQMPLAARVKQADVEEHAQVVGNMAASPEQAMRMANYARARKVLADFLAGSALVTAAIQ